ncbi:MAG: HAMP domain-containing histidine kinase [Alphaproteobacteria bacterium]|nr:HAMP domain-containing histidine kinase [Alphaproteobacteria bacterium]
MAVDAPKQLRAMQSLSARLLVLTMAFVMLSEVLIYLPSIARFRMTWLEQRLDEAHLSMLALIETTDPMVSRELRLKLLEQVGAHSIALRLPARRYLALSEDMPPNIDAVVDLTRDNVLLAIADALRLLAPGPIETIRVIGMPKAQRSAVVELVLPVSPLRTALIEYSWRILTLSLIISVVTAMLVYMALRWLIVHPMQRITASMVGFREAPEDPNQLLIPSMRRDEVGIAERELAEMQRQLRQALRQRARLAALGLAVSKVNHDLRNILATAQIVSDRLTASDDPEVRRLTPRLIDSLDRAIALCSSTLQYGRLDEPPPNRLKFRLAGLVDEVGATVAMPHASSLQWRNNVPPELVVNADREQMFRVLLNIAGNAAQAMGNRGIIEINAHQLAGRVEIDVRDNGPGLPPRAREHLFEAFAGTSRPGGSGLGLPIARDLMRAHGGDVQLVESGPGGTQFRLLLPSQGSDRALLH